jgi:5-methyltetrahydropteroyltriglutamate--homocysteine methyltransferase
VTAKSAAAAARATVYGYPRQGPARELKKAIESYWKGRVTADALRATAAELRRATWRQLAEAGVHEVPTGDFSYYDHVLDTTVMVGAVPERHRAAVDTDALDGYFAMARGTQDIAPLEMTKWFDTNYHYLVPELGPDTGFAANSAKQVGELREALALGVAARPVLVGPVTYLLLAKPAPGVPAGFDPLTLLDRLLPVYAEVLADLRAAGAEWVQLDEPALVQDRTPAELKAVARAYRDLGARPDRPKLLVASYFDRLGEALPVLAKAPVEGLALDFTGAAAADLDALAAVGGLPGKRLIAGVVNGRNIWVNDLSASLTTPGTLLGFADRVDVAASCSLLHVPLDTAAERDIEPQILRWLAFARQKTAEIVTLAKGLAQGPHTIAAELAANRADLASRAASPITHDPGVRARAAAVTAFDGRRSYPYRQRAAAQRAHLRLPLLPTTTIGSFPQTGELRTARADLRAGRIDTAGYEERVRAEIQEVVAFQEKTGLDVLVHGEPERNDMVQYFAEQLTGYLATRHGWVQS